MIEGAKFKTGYLTLFSCMKFPPKTFIEGDKNDRVSFLYNKIKVISKNIHDLVLCFPIGSLYTTLLLPDIYFRFYL